MGCFESFATAAQPAYADVSSAVLVSHEQDSLVAGLDEDVCAVSPQQRYVALDFFGLNFGG